MDRAEADAGVEELARAVLADGILALVACSQLHPAAEDQPAAEYRETDLPDRRGGVVARRRATSGEDAERGRDSGQDQGRGRPRRYALGRPAAAAGQPR